MRVITFFVYCFILIFCTAAKAENTGAEFTSFAGFELGSVTLSDVQHKLGKARVVATGEAGEYTASVCYRVPTGVILFYAGEMDGPEHGLGGFGFARETKRQPCAPWPNSLARPELAIAGLRLGLTLDEFTRIVATPVQTDNNERYAFFESKKTMSKEDLSRLPKTVQAMIRKGEQQDYFDVVIAVIGRFVDGHLVELRVWQTETI